MYGLGHIALAEEFQEHPVEVRAHLIQTMTQLRYEKQLRNLHLQESRLIRRREKELAELRTLQQERGRQEEAANATPKSPAEETTSVPQTTAPVEVVENGFEFSTREIDYPDASVALSEGEPDLAAAA